MKIINILQKILREQTVEPEKIDITAPASSTYVATQGEPKIGLELSDKTSKPTGVSDKLVEFVKKEEYFVPCVYDDANGTPCIKKDWKKCCLKGRTPSGIATIGYGTVYRPDGSKVKPSDKDITVEIATEYLKSTLDSIAKKLLLKYPNLTQQQLDGLSSLCYNVGFAGCTSKAPNLSAAIKKDPNSKTNPNIEPNFLDFTNTKRRTSEFSIYDDGNYQIV
jgi:GH24 family phage-related lysozyme (muramidase)